MAFQPRGARNWTSASSVASLSAADDGPGPSLIQGQADSAGGPGVKLQARGNGIGRGGVAERGPVGVLEEVEDLSPRCPLLEEGRQVQESRLGVRLPQGRGQTVRQVVPP